MACLNSGQLWSKFEFHPVQTWILDLIGGKALTIVQQALVYHLRNSNYSKNLEYPKSLTIKELI